MAKKDFRPGDILIVVHNQSFNPDMHIGDKVTFKGYCYGCEGVLVEEFPEHFSENDFVLSEDSKSKRKTQRMFTQEEVFRMFRKLVIIPAVASEKGFISIDNFNTEVCEILNDFDMRKDFVQYLKENK